MRWGVRDEATDDHMTTVLCMTEIDNCQRLSVGPNFVVCIQSALSRTIMNLTYAANKQPYPLSLGATWRGRCFYTWWKCYCGQGRVHAFL